MEKRIDSASRANSKSNFKNGYIQKRNFVNNPIPSGANA